MSRPRRYEERRVVTAVRLPESLHLRLKAAAEQRDLSVNYLVERSITEFLETFPQPEAAIGKMTREPPQRPLRRGISTQPERQPIVIGQHLDARIVAALAPDDVRDPVAAGGIAAHELAGDGGGAAAFVDGANLRDGK